MAGPAIRTRALTKVYTRGGALKRLLGRGAVTVAVKDLDLEVERGEIFGFLGPNGAGKSTTMAMITGIIRPTSGSVRILGTDMSGHGREARLGMGYSSEAPALYRDMGVLDLVRYHGSFYGIPGERLEERIHELLSDLDLEGQEDVPAGRLSHGNRKKVSLAIAMVHDPEVLVLDEPTAGLDPGTVVTVRDLLEDLRDRGRTIFLSSHILTEIERTCDRVGIIHAGRLRALETLGEIGERWGDEEGDGGLERAFLELTGHRPTGCHRPGNGPDPSGGDGDGG